MGRFSRLLVCQLSPCNLVAGTYGRNVAIATGEWAEAMT